MIDNQAHHRFEATEDGKLAFADYRREAGRYILMHIEADPGLRGTGAAGRLMEAIVAHAREHCLALTPRCPYAKEWFQRHPEASDVQNQA